MAELPEMKVDITINSPKAFPGSNVVVYNGRRKAFDDAEVIEVITYWSKERTLYNYRVKLKRRGVMLTVTELVVLDKEQCPEFPYFGASYPDARCINGNLHDLDKCDNEGNLYKTDESNPCPFCRTKDFLQDQLDNEEDIGIVINWMESIKGKYGKSE